MAALLATVMTDSGAVRRGSDTWREGVRFQLEEAGVGQELIEECLDLLSKQPEGHAPDDISAFVGSVVGSGHLEVEGDLVGRDKLSVEIDLGKLGQDFIEPVLGLAQTIAKQPVRPDAATIASRLPLSPSGLELGNLLVPPFLVEKVACGADTEGIAYRVPVQEIDTVEGIVGGWDLQPMLAGEAAFLNPHLLLTGSPGKGKSIVLQLIAQSAAKGLSSDEVGKAAERLGAGALCNEGRFPILVSFSEFVSESGPLDLFEFGISEASKVTKTREALSSWAEKGKLLILVDEVDLVWNVDRLKAGIEALIVAKERSPQNRIIVAARGGNLSEELLHAAGFAIVELAVLGDSTAAELVGNWNAALAASTDEKKCDQASSTNGLALESLRAEIWRNPRFLSFAALLHALGESVTCREEFSLLNACFDTWFKAWDSGEDAHCFEDVPRSRVERALEELGFEAQLTVAPGPMSLSLVLDVLQKHLGQDWGKAQRLVKSLAAKTGLLSQTGHEISFAFPNVRELLASRYLARMPNFVERSVELLDADPARWHFVFPSSAHIAGPEKALFAINAACDAWERRAGGMGEYELARGSLGALADLAENIDLSTRDRVGITDRVRRLGMELMGDSAVPLNVRAEVGDHLSVIGDPRRGVQDLLGSIISVPGGPLLLGNTDQGFGEFNIAYDYWISEFQVTCGQFHEFLTRLDGPEWAHERWRGKRLGFERSVLSHPITNVSWGDTARYSSWLSQELVLRELEIPSSYVVRLPTEAEWLKAFRGGLQIDGLPNPSPKRRFPWGDHVQPEAANLPSLLTRRAGVLPVGIFPANVSPYGVADLLGNVMEWTNTSWGGTDIENPGFGWPYTPKDGREAVDAPGYRVLRGGSWLFDESQAACSCRLDPEMRYEDVGFRVVVAPAVNDIRAFT